MEPITQVIASLSRIMFGLSRHEIKKGAGIFVALLGVIGLWRMFDGHNKPSPMAGHQTIILECAVFANKSDPNYRFRFVPTDKLYSKSGKVFEGLGDLKILNLENEELDELHVSCMLDMKEESGSLIDKGDVISQEQSDPEIRAFRTAFKRVGIQFYNIQCNSDGTIREGYWRLKDDSYSGTFKIG